MVHTGVHEPPIVGFGDPVVDIIGSFGVPDGETGRMLLTVRDLIGISLKI